MSDPQGNRNPVEELAERFLERYRRGERPALTEYTHAHPALADEIRDLFPALVMMEEAGPVDTAPLPAAVPAPRQIGDYRIVREIGRGGMGVVYEAVQESLGRHVALKVLFPDAGANPICVERFRREARAAARLHHTNIVPVYDVGEAAGTHYYTMQFIQGQALDEVLSELRRLRHGAAGAMATAVTRSIADGLLTGRLGDAPTTSIDPPPSTPTASHSSSAGLSGQTDYQFFRGIARLILQAADALDYAHGQKILHRDIKPSNLLLDLHGTLWVNDFGLAKDESADLTRTGDVVGTLRYLAPERLENVSDPRTDVYGLGLTLYECVTLRPAFDESERVRLLRQVAHDEPPAPRTLEPRLPRDLETIILRATAKEPGRRYQTAAALADDLRRFLSDRPIQARRSSLREQVWRWGRRNPGWAAMLGTAVGLLIVIAFGGVWYSVRLNDALTTARTAETAAQTAERATANRNWTAQLERARALVASGRIGQRYGALAVIREAARFQVTAELRDVAIAALVLPDARIAHEWNGWPDGTLAVAFDAAFDRYARLDRNGGVAVCRRGPSGEEVLISLPVRGIPPFANFQISPDGRHVALTHGSADSGVQTSLVLWRLDDPPVEVPVAVSGAGIAAVAFSPDGRLLAVGHDTVVRVHDVDTGRLLWERAWPVVATTFAFHPADGRLAVANGTEVVVISPVAGIADCVLQHSIDAQKVMAVAWHPDGRHVATGCDDRKIHYWDVGAAIELMSPWVGHTGFGIGLAFSPTGDRLASGDFTRQTRLWDTATGRLVMTLPDVGYQFSRAGLLGPQRVGPALRMWEVTDGSELRVVRRRGAEPSEPIHHPVWHADGRHFATNSGDWLCLFHATGQERQQPLSPKTRRPRSGTGIRRAGGSPVAMAMSCSGLPGQSRPVVWPSARRESWPTRAAPR